jgi:hypothetical protein
MRSLLPNVKAENCGLPGVIDDAVIASGGDLRVAVVSFVDNIDVNLNFTTDLAAAKNAIASLNGTGGFGSSWAEVWAQALSEVITGTVGSQCTVSPVSFDRSFRDTCAKHVVLVTDAYPGTCALHPEDVASDLATASAMASAAAARGIRISEHAKGSLLILEGLSRVRPLGLAAWRDLFQRATPDGLTRPTRAMAGRRCLRRMPSMPRSLRFSPKL